jgi:hypothetical protein
MIIAAKGVTRPFDWHTATRFVFPVANLIHIKMSTFKYTVETVFVDNIFSLMDFKKPPFG